MHFHGLSNVLGRGDRQCTSLSARMSTKMHSRQSPKTNRLICVFMSYRDNLSREVRIDMPFIWGESVIRTRAA